MWLCYHHILMRVCSVTINCLSTKTLLEKLCRKSGDLKLLHPEPGYSTKAAIFMRRD
jgi:hypothetical protein